MATGPIGRNAMRHIAIIMAIASPKRKFLLRKMQDQEQKQGYSAKVRAWLAKPEQTDLVKSIKATISPNMKPEKQEQALLTQAKNYVRNTGIKLS